MYDIDKMLEAYGFKNAQYLLTQLLLLQAVVLNKITKLKSVLQFGRRVKIVAKLELKRIYLYNKLNKSLRL